MAERSRKRFVVELDRLRREFQQLQSDRSAQGEPGRSNALRHLDRLRQWLDHVDAFRRKFLDIEAEPEHAAEGPRWRH